MIQMMDVSNLGDNVWVIYFPDDSPIDGDHMVNPGRHRLKVSCHAFAVLSQGVASDWKIHDISLGRKHQLQWKKTTHIFWGENTHHVQCSIVILLHTHQIVILISQS
jgi:hypothetical protein